MRIEWPTLIAIAVTAAAATVTVVLLVSFALVGLSARGGRRVDGRASGARPAPGLAGAALCLTAAGLIVAYGFSLIIA